MEDRVTAATTACAQRPEHNVLGILLLWLLATQALWLLAFYREPAATPEWLLRAQAACFGSDESGLPNAAGWTVLALAPLSMLLGFVVSYHHEIGSALRQWLASTLGITNCILLTTLVALQAGWTAKQIKAGLAVVNTSYASDVQSALPESYPQGTQAAPEFSLVNQHGEAVTLAQFSGNPLIVTIAFAHCTTVCPVVIKTLQQGLASAPPNTQALILTLDPWRDTPSSLPGLAKRWQLDTRTHVLSGAPDQVMRVLDGFGVARTRDEKSGDVVHPALVYIIDKAGRIAYTFNNPPAQWLSEAINRVNR